MKPLSWDNQQLGLASPLQSAASQSGQPITLARMRGLDVSHHTRISPRGGEKSFFLTSSPQKLIYVCAGTSCNPSFAAFF
jgi:hypothetical protein